MINVYIDEFTPCLKDGKTGQLIDTEVVRVVRKSLLQNYNKKNGWYVNWVSLLDENEVYALVIKGTVDIQGLVAVKNDENAKACYVCWMCTAPENNKLLVDEPKYLGVGGHLFAIAAKKSIDYGYDGFMYGFAANEELLRHYVEKLNAEAVKILHPYHFLIGEEYAKKIMEDYNYEWTDGKI